MSTLDVLRGLAADQGVPVQELPAAPKAAPAPPRDYEGTVRVEKKSPDWRRPKEALKDRSLTLENTKDATPSGKQWAWLKDGALARALTPGTRAYVKGRFAPKGEDKWRLSERLLDLSDVVALPAASAKDISAKAASALFDVELAQVSAWCDHFPTSGRRQNLVVTTTLSNKTDKPLTIKLARVFLSFGAGKEGALVSGLTLRGEDGRPSAESSLTLAPKETKKLDWRGDGLYPEGSHDKTLYVTLSLASENKTLFVRGQGDVLATQ